MPVICDTLPLSTKLSENLSLGFKKSEKENYESHPVPTVKQVLSAKIEYEEVPNLTNSNLNALQTKYILLKPNQQALTLTENVHANSKTNNCNDKSNINTNERNVNNVNGSSTSLPSASSSSSSSSSDIKLPQPKRVLFQKDKIHIGWSNHGQVKSWSSGCGFTNIGNTCYLNSALQAFFHVPALAQWLISDREHREKSQCKDNTQCIICAMSSTLIHTHKNNSGSFTPSQITNRLSQICKHLTPGRQEDAHEFLRYLVEKMEKSFLFRYRCEPWFKDLDQYSKETTPLNQILGGYLRSTVTCLSCNHDSVTFQHFQDLALDITRATTLSEAISGFFSRENLEECGYKCESCKKRVSAAKRFTLERAPVVLCIQFKRFTAMGGKMSKHIPISERLSLQKYLSKQSDQHQDCSYKFVSMVTHLGGTASGGHYTAVGMSPSGNFYHFDDSRVSSIPLENALRGNAYVLFYELVQESKHYVNGTQNGHSIFHENGHNYIKNRYDHSINGSSSSLTSPSSSALSNAGRLNQMKTSNEASFSKPSLPKMIPSNVIKNQQQQIKQQQQQPQTIQLTKNGVKSPSNVWSSGGNISPSITKINGNNKREIVEQEQDSKNDSKKFKPTSQLPSVPRLIDSDNEEKSPTKSLTLPSLHKTNSIISNSNKPKSLVPYGSDDEDEDEINKKEDFQKEPQIGMCRTSSGIFIETDFKENGKIPSKQGSTIVTKASVALDSIKKELSSSVAANKHFNGNSVRSEDPISQLTKLNHSGYGTSNVISWNNVPTNMNKEVCRDQQEDRKRQYDNEDDIEMDRGRTKKLKYNSHQNMKGKLPNPFNGLQNAINNQNSAERHNGNHNKDRINPPFNGNGYNRPHFNNYNKPFRRFGSNGKDHSHNNKPFYSNNRNNNHHRGHHHFNNSRR